MKLSNKNKELIKSIKDNIKKIEEAKKEQKTILAQTIYLGTVGIIFIFPTIVGAYLGVWLDNTLKGFSFSWTVSLIFLGIFVGAVNVYLFIKD